MPVSYPVKIIDSTSAVYFIDGPGSVLTAENITSVVKATGNDVPAYYPTLFASMLEKSDGCAMFCKMGGKRPTADTTETLKNRSRTCIPPLKNSSKQAIEDVSTDKIGAKSWRGTWWISLVAVP